MALVVAGCGAGVITVVAAASGKDPDRAVHPVAALAVLAALAVAMIGLHASVTGRVPFGAFGIALGAAVGAALAEAFGVQAGVDIGSSSFVLAFAAAAYLLIRAQPPWRLGQAGIFFVLCAALTGLVYVLAGAAFDDVRTRLDEQIVYELGLGLILFAIALTLSKQLPLITRLLSLLGVLVPIVSFGLGAASPATYLLGGAAIAVGWVWLGFILVRASSGLVRH